MTGVTVDPRTRRNTLRAISRCGGPRALRGSRSVERARQHECSTDTCTRHLQLRSELRQSSPATLHSSRWQADGDLRCVTDSHEDGAPRQRVQGMGMRADEHTCSRAAAVAVQEGPPSPAARPGPIHGMGRAVRCRAHTLTGPASAETSLEGGECPTCARTFFAWPAQAGKA